MHTLLAYVVSETTTIVNYIDLHYVSDDNLVVRHDFGERIGMYCGYVFPLERP